MTTARERHERLAISWGLSGAWQQVGRAAIMDRTIRISPGYYFLVWNAKDDLGVPQGSKSSDLAILWEEGHQGPDSRIPPLCYWLMAWCSAVIADPVQLRVFRAGQEFPHRQALLRHVGFHQSEGPFGFMELVSSPVPWEW